MILAANNYQPGDRNRSEIDPDSLVKGVEDIIMDAEARERLYNFIARYVRKVCPDSIITKGLHAMPGYTFLDLIRPSDVAYVISLLKNGRGMWDMEIEMREMARSGEIKTIKNHQIKMDIILLIDWWEHAWALDYQADKKKYLENQWKIINWDVINTRVDPKS